MPVAITFSLMTIEQILMWIFHNNLYPVALDLLLLFLLLNITMCRVDISYIYSYVHRQSCVLNRYHVNYCPYCQTDMQ